MDCYYILKPNEDVLEEVTESEYLSLFGDENTSVYSRKVYYDEISIEDVPEEFRNTVSEIVVNRTNRYGSYSERIIPPNEFQSMIEEVL